MNAPKGSIARIALCALIILALLAPALAEVPAPAPEPRDQTVRVLLSRLGVTDRLDVVLSSAYQLETSDGALIRFDGGSELAMLLVDGSLYLHYAGMSLNAGDSLRLSRYKVEDGVEYGFRRANYPALYAGDLSLYIEDGLIRPVLAINVEAYLLGVVPYEMSDIFPLEALKAQAIAARTYALRKQSASRPYDLVDTTNDQVFRGYITGYGNAERAIAETRGVCGYYDGKLALCYYSASNGGQTERTITVWPGGENLGYYAFGEDKFDVENPQSVVKSIVIPKRYKEGEVAPYGLRKLLAVELHDKLQALGYDPAPESVRVDEVMALSVDTPAGEKGSKLMTKLKLTARISARTKTEAPIVLSDDDAEEVSLFAVEDPIAAEASGLTAAASEATPSPEQTPEPTPAPTPIYGSFTAIAENVVLDADIFPTAESCLALNISTNLENELWLVNESADAFTLEARRYGHGVGMSQRGAQWMAGSYNMTCEAILAFYYPGMQLIQYAQEDDGALSEDEPLSAAAGPAPSPTPRPTLMPITIEPGEGQWLAAVTGIDDDSSLNLRSTPDMSGDIVMRLYKNQRLLVLERCPEEGWVKVRTDSAEGYVVEKFLSTVDE